MSKRVLVTAALVLAAVLGPVATLRADTPPGAPVEVSSDAPPATAGADVVEPELQWSEAGTDLEAWEDAAGQPLQAAGAAAPDGRSRYVPVTPTRVLDTRDGTGGWGKFPAHANLPVQIAGLASVPSNASAVVLNLTVTAAENVGYVTVYPWGQGVPLASTINVEYVGQTIANLVTVPLGGGFVGIYSQSQTHLIADVAGYYLPASTSTTGRYQAVTPTRLLDTRDPGQHPGPFSPGEPFPLDVAGLAGLPRSAGAAVLNLTATGAASAGFVSITPHGAPLGGVSNLNVDYGGQTIANQVIVPLNNGYVTVYSAIATHLVVDLDGWYTGADAAASGDGLFVPVTPGRLLDTREPSNSPIFGLKPGADRGVDVANVARFNIPSSGFQALVVNATATETSAAGFFTLHGAGLGRPLASNLNANWPNQTIPNHAVVPVSTAGLSFYTSSGASLIIDVAGYFTGTAPAPAAGYVPNGGSGPPSSGAHTFLYKVAGSYARWNPCSAIPFQVNYNGAPAFARTEVANAVAKLEAASGLDLVDMGDTSAGNDGTPPAGMKAVIAFVSAAENSRIASVAGLGGGAYYPPANGRPAYVANGFVLINESIGYGQGTGPTGLEGLLLHELGHMAGLDHVADTNEAMYGIMHYLPSAGYGPGDREGLWKLGAAQGCIAGANSFGAQSTAALADPVRVEQAQTAATPPTPRPSPVSPSGGLPGHVEAAVTVRTRRSR